MKHCNAKGDLLGRVRVPLVAEGDREHFDRLPEAEHYLRGDRIAGRRVRYAAAIDGAWVALRNFGGAAPHSSEGAGRADWLESAAAGAASV